MAGRTAVIGGPAKVTEKAFSQTVVEYARLNGWRVWRPWLAIHSPRGFPDLTMVRDGRLVFAELKSDSGKTTEAQEEWLAELREVPGVTAVVWRPSDWDDVERTLCRTPRLI